MLPGLLYADESEKDLKGKVRRLVEVCKRRGLSFNARGLGGG